MQRFTIGGKTYSGNELQQIRTGRATTGKTIDGDGLSSSTRLPQDSPIASTSTPSPTPTSSAQSFASHRSQVRYSPSSTTGDEASERQSSISSAPVRAGVLPKRSDTALGSFVTASSFRQSGGIRTGMAINDTGTMPKSGRAAFDSFAASSAKSSFSNYSSIGAAYSGLKSSGREAIGMADSAIRSNDDLGAQSVSGILQTGTIGATVFKTAQDLSPLAFKAAISTPKVALNTAKRGVDVVSTAGRATVTVANTFGLAASAAMVGVPISYNFARDIMTQQAVATGLNKTMLSKNIVDCTKRIQHGVSAAKARVVGAYKGTVQTAKNINMQLGRAYVLTKGVLSGSVGVGFIASRGLDAFKGFAKIQGATLVKGGASALFKGGSFAYKKGLPFAGGVALGASGWLSKQDDMGLQGVGNAIKLGHTGVKTSVTAGRMTKAGVKTAYKVTIKTATAVTKSAAIIKTKGVIGASKVLGAKLASGLAAAGGSVVTGAIGALKAVSMKFVVPLIIIIALIMGLYTIMAGPISAAGALFGGSFSVGEDGEYSDWDIRDFLLEYALPPLREELVNDIEERIESNLIQNGGDYHIVRFFTGTSPYPVDDVYDAIISLASLVEIIQPIFTGVMIRYYELQPTEEQAINRVNEMFEMLFHITEESHMEWCGQSHETGEGEPEPCISCGVIYAYSDCLNPVSGVHYSFTCSTCCYMWCPGHSSEEGTWFCSGCVHNCIGFVHCGGHLTLHITLTMDGIHQLLYKYFLSPIDYLLNLAYRTPAQEDELQELQDLLEIVLELMAMMSSMFGGGMSMADLEHVDWVVGSRTGSIAIAELAISQVGQVGGMPYWSFMGFGSRIEWCGAFTFWVYHIAGYGSHLPAHGYTPPAVNMVWTVAMRNHFMSAGQWQSSSFTNLAPGDKIFFDWTLNGQPNHVGIVLGRCVDFVYFVDGNWGDAVALQKRPLSNINILGYATILP